MTDDDGSDKAENTGLGGDAKAPPDTQEPSGFPSSWEDLLEAVRRRLHEQIAVWPEKVTETIDLVDCSTSSGVPTSGDILIYVHGYLGAGRLDGLNISGQNQAAALRQALTDEFEGADASPPTVVAATWNSSTIWPLATNRAVTAGETLARWVRTHADRYDRVTIVGHSLGGRVAIVALSHLDECSLDSVGLLGAAVLPETVYTDYRDGIESGVDRGVFNYHSRNDAVVCRLYSFRAGDAGIGCNGARVASEESLGTLPANYVDVDVSEQVHRHMDYFKPLPETAGGNCVHDLIARQLQPDAADSDD